MVKPFQVNVIKDEITPFINKFSKKFPEELTNLTASSASIVKDSVKRQFLIKQKAAPRQKTASMFQVKKQQKWIWDVSIPLKSYFLDSMRPHHVSLKPGRNITKWAKNYYHKSNDGKLPNALYVRPDPFIDAGVMLSRTRLRHLYRKTIKNTLE